jgi:hypothetical protein
VKEPRRLLNRSHRAAVVEAILVILDDCRDCLEHVFVTVFHDLLQIEILDRNVVVAEFEVAAHGFEIGLFHRPAHLLYL